jgi:hypothetical protein
MRPHDIWTLTVLATLGFASSCANRAAPQPQAPEPAPAQPAATPGPGGAAEPAAAQPTAAGSDAQQAKAGDAPKAAEDTTVADDAFKLDRPPREIITTEDTTFEFSFTSSEIGEQTEQRCRSEAGDDMQAYAQCKRDAQEKVPVRIQRFAEKRGTWWWITYERRGKQLITLHRIPIDFGEEAPNSVTIVPKGKDQGLAPLSPLPRKVVVNVPNSYSIQMEDPEYGLLSYSAKIGLIPSSKSK